MGKYITCRKNYRIFLLGFFVNILVSIICFYFLNLLGLVSTDNNSPKNNNTLLFLLLNYIGKSFFVIVEIIINKFVVKKNVKKCPSSALSIKYIYNDYTKLTHREYIIIFIISIFIFFNDILKSIIIQLYNNLKGRIFFAEIYTAIESIYLYPLSMYFIHKKYYKHQKISIFYIIISSLIIYLLRTKYDIDTLLILLYQVFTSFFNAMFVIYRKYLMDFRYFSIYKVTCLFGIINCIILIIVYIIISFIPCDFNLCNLEYNNKHFIDNIIYIFSNLNMLKIVIFILCAILLGLLDIIKNYYINKYTIYCFFILIENKEELLFLFDESEDNKNSILEFFFFLILDFSQIFFILVYQETIELNFCGLDKNLKINIENRAENDLNFTRTESDDIMHNEDNIMNNEDDNVDEEVNKDNNNKEIKNEL